jgi:hypothetical protein
MAEQAKEKEQDKQKEQSASSPTAPITLPADLKHSILSHSPLKPTPLPSPSSQQQAAEDERAKEQARVWAAIPPHNAVGVLVSGCIEGANFAIAEPTKWNGGVWSFFFLSHLHFFLFWLRSVCDCGVCCAAAHLLSRLSTQSTDGARLLLLCWPPSELCCATVFGGWV